MVRSRSEAPAAPQAALGRRVSSLALWGLWDHLFGFAGIAAVVGCVLSVIVGAAITALPYIPPGLPLLGTMLTGGLIGLVTLALSWAGFCEYARGAVTRDNARWEDFRRGLSRPASALRCMFAAGFAMLLLIINGVFYGTVSGQKDLGLAIQLGAATAGMLAIWVFVLALFLLWAGMCDPSGEPAPGPLSAVRRGYERVMVAPRAWLGAVVMLGCLSVLCVISILGIVFIVPIAAVMGVAAADVGERHRQFLVESSSQLGAGASLESVLRKTAEKWEAWEARQPRRSLRQLIRPWEE